MNLDDLGAFFAGMPPELTQALPDEVSVTFALTGDGGGTWTVARAGEDLRVRAGRIGRPDCTLGCSTADFRALLRGGLDPRRGFLEGRLTVQGDVGLVLRLHRLLAHEASGA